MSNFKFNVDEPICCPFCYSTNIKERWDNIDSSRDGEIVVQSIWCGDCGESLKGVFNG